MPQIFAEAIREARESSERVYEAVIAIVVNNVDPEKLGRVKLRFPTLPGQSESFWAPIAALGAGKQRGWFFLPEIDDEVVVMFEHGDIRKPVVVGAVWNTSSEGYLPPDRNDSGENNNRRVFQSRGKKNTTGKGSRVELDDELGTITIEDGEGVAKVVISADGSISITTRGDACLQAPGGDVDAVAANIRVTAKDALKIHSGSDMAMGANTIEVSASSSLSAIGAPTNFNSGGARGPAGTEAQCQEVPDSFSGDGGGGGQASEPAATAGAATGAEAAAAATTSVAEAGSGAASILDGGASNLGANLPSVPDLGINLPAVPDLGINLPAVPDLGINLPAVPDFGVPIDPSQLGGELMNALNEPAAMIANMDQALADQLQQSASTMTANLTRGLQSTGQDQVRLFGIATASANDVRECFRVAEAQGYVTGAPLERPRELVDQVLSVTSPLGR